MAQEVAFKVLVDTLAAEKSIGELKEEFKSLNNQILDLKVGTEEYNQATTRLAAVKHVLGGIEEDIQKIAGANQRAAVSVSPLQREYRELRNAIESGKLGAEETEKALIRMGQVKGQIRDLAQQVNALDPERKFAAFAKIGSVVASGFAAAQAATALFGEENEDLIKTLVKVQAATALAQGLQGLAGFQKALVQAGLAMKAFALSNPFTAIAAGVVALTLVIYKLVSAINGQSEAVRKLNKEYEQTQKLNNERIRQLENEITALGGVKDAEQAVLEKRQEILELQIKVSQVSVMRQRQIFEEAKANGTLYESLLKIYDLTGTTNLAEQQRLKRISGLAEELKKQQDLLDQLNASLTANANEQLEKWKEGLRKESEELVKSQKENTAKRVKSEEDAWKEILKTDEEAIDQAIKLAEEEADRFIALQKSKWQAAKDFYSSLIDLQLENQAAQADLDEDPLAQEEARYQQQLVNLATFEEERKLAIEESDFSDVEKATKKAELLDQINIRREITTKQHEKNITNITTTATEQRKQMQIYLVQSGFDTVGNLAQAFAGKSEASQRKAFNIQKAANVATAIIDTYTAAQGAYKSQMTIPTPDAPIRAAIAAGIAIASGLARVAIISKTQFQSTGGGEASAPSGGGDFSSPQAPSINPPQVTATQTNTNNEGDFQSFNRPQQPLRAYVVETELTSSQNRIKGIEERARF